MAGRGAPGGDGWRLSKLDDLPLYTRPGEVVTALVARDQQLRLSLQLPAAAKATARPALKRSGKSPAAPDGNARQHQAGHAGCRRGRQMAGGTVKRGCRCAAISGSGRR
jgi:hypothetical protein